MLPFTAARLAPSPTGALHLGHARTFLITWWLARQAGAKIYMRMEDIDAGRAKPEAVQQAYDDLRWLGIDWDAYPHGDAIVVQSARLQHYHQTLEKLWHADAIYPCICTRGDIAAAVAASAGAPQEGDPQPRYPGTCRPLATLPARSLVEAPHAIAQAIHAKTGKHCCWRLRVPPGAVTFEDAIAGPQSVDVDADSGDFPLTRFPAPGETLGPPAYQLACVADDHAMNIDMVIRGNDLLPSTPRQLLIYHALGWTPPRFAHVPLVIGTDGKRLAKRHGESRIAQFRAAGVAPEKIVGWAAWRSGQLDTPQSISATDMIQRFDLTRLPNEPVILNQTDLAHLA